MKKRPLELSDDKRRGEQAHIRAALTQLGVMRGLPCTRCRRPGTQLIGVRESSPRVACDRCADEWRSLSYEQRSRQRSEWR